MKLEKLITVNWGALPPCECDMGSMTMFTGENGAGKSTLIDAMQAMMTGMHHNVYNFNSAQGEQSQQARNGKSKRTLPSYIVGAEDNLFARPEGAHGYVAGVFQPSEGETGEPFTAVLGAIADVETNGKTRTAVLVKLTLLIVDKARLEFSDFAEKIDGELSVRAVDTIEEHLKRKYPHVQNWRDSRKEYLCQLYGRFRGLRSVSIAEAEKAAKAWVKAIAVKEIGSVADLIKNEILEFNPAEHAQNISQLSSMMSSIAELTEDSIRLNRNIEELQVLDSEIEESTKAFQQAAVFRVAAVTQAKELDEAEISTIEGRIGKDDALIADVQGALKKLATRKKNTETSLIDIKATLKSSSAHRAIEEADLSIARATTDAQTALAAISAAMLHLQNLEQASVSIAEMAITKDRVALYAASMDVLRAQVGRTELKRTRIHELIGLLSQQNGLREEYAEELAMHLDGVQQRYAASYEAIAAPQDSFVDALRREKHAVDHALLDARTNEASTAMAKQKLAKGEFNYGPAIERALAAVKGEFPGARAIILAELIDVVPGTKWQDAIERYMGQARFNLVVDENYEERVTSFLRRNHFSQVRVVQGAYCLRNAPLRKIPENSVYHELRTAHPIADAYLIEQFSGVVKVDSVETLRSTPRGVTLDGIGSGSRTMHATGEVQLAFGQAARQAALDSAVAKHLDAQQKVRELEAQETDLRGAQAITSGLAKPSFEATMSLWQAATEYQRAHASRALLDVSDIEKLLKEQKSLESDLEQLDADVINQTDRRAMALQRIATANSNVNRLREGLPARENAIVDARAALRTLCEIDNTLLYSTLEQSIKDATGDHSVADLNGRVTSHRMNASGSLMRVVELVREYNQGAKDAEKLKVRLDLMLRESEPNQLYGLACEIRQQGSEQLKAQKNIGLAQNTAKLQKAQDSFSEVFTGHFCMSIRNSIDSGLRSLRELNKELERLVFGTDVFCITFDSWVPEFKEYYDLFDEVQSIGDGHQANQLSIFEDNVLSENGTAVLHRLRTLLTSRNEKNESVARDELLRIADYRNYKVFDIHKRSTQSNSVIELSKWGVGSGGQLETPAYIIRAAAVTHRLKHFEKGMNLKLLVSDESFKNMDETRALDVMHFLRDKLGLQFICAMPTKHAGALKPVFTKEYAFTRTVALNNGEVNFISEFDERDLNSDKLRELWDRRRAEARQKAASLFDLENPPEVHATDEPSANDASEQVRAKV